jgi:hypothetical protein
VTNAPCHPQSSHHPRRPPPAARRALTVLGAPLLSLAATAVAAPAASATPPPTEPPAGPPPPPPGVTAPGLPLWAVLVIVVGAITLAAATTLITLALQPGHRCKPPQPTHTGPARPMHQPPPAAQARRPRTHQHSHPAQPPTHGCSRHPPAATHVHSAAQEAVMNSIHSTPRRQQHRNLLPWFTR